MKYILCIRIDDEYGTYSYPPHGLRLTTSDGLDELADDVREVMSLLDMPHLVLRPSMLSIIKSLEALASEGCLWGLWSSDGYQIDADTAIMR